MSERVLVTGGAGFIGSHVVDGLFRAGAVAAVLDNFDDFYAAETKRANIAAAADRPGFRLYEADLRDRAAIDRAVVDFAPDAIVHLAARAGVRPSLENPALYTEVNITGTVNLFEAAIQLPRVPRIVYASSSSVYGDRSEGPFRESDPVDFPLSPYAATKRSCELLAHVYHAIHGVAMTGLRFFTAYGPRNRPDLAIAKFADLIELGRPVPMFGDGTTLRDYTYVEDIAAGVIAAVEKCSGYHIYNLGNSHPIELSRMIACIASAVGKPALVDRRPEQPGDVRQTFADISLARRELGYDPKTAFEEGIARYVAWRGERAEGARSLAR